MQTATAAAAAGGLTAPQSFRSPMTASSADVVRLRELERLEYEAEKNYTALRQQLDNLSTKICAQQLHAQRVEEAMKTLEEAGPQCVAYRSVARLFVMTPPKQLEKRLTEELQQLQQKELPKLHALKKELVVRVLSIVDQRREYREEYARIRSGNSDNPFFPEPDERLSEREKWTLEEEEDSKRDA